MIEAFSKSAFNATFGLFPRVWVDFGGGVMVQGVKNTSSHYDEKELGGYEDQDEMRLTFKTDQLKTNPNSLIGTVVTIAKVEWRIVRVNEGSVATGMTFVSPDKA